MPHSRLSGSVFADKHVPASTHYRAQTRAVHAGVHVGVRSPCVDLISRIGY